MGSFESYCAALLNAAVPAKASHTRHLRTCGGHLWSQQERTLLGKHRDKPNNLYFYNTSQSTGNLLTSSIGSTVLLD